MFARDDAAMATITSREGTAPPFINNANSYGHSTQTIIGSINHYTRIPDDRPLWTHDVGAGEYFILASTADSCQNTKVLHNCRRLHFLISQASLIYPSSTAVSSHTTRLVNSWSCQTKSYCYRIRTLLSSIYEAIAKPHVSALNFQPCETYLDTPADIITKVLLVCGKAIHDFESKARQGTSFCMMTDLNELRNSLRNCLFYLFTSLLWVTADSSDGPWFSKANTVVIGASTRRTHYLEVQLLVLMKLSAICLGFTGDVKLSSSSSLGAALPNLRILSNSTMLLEQPRSFRSPWYCVGLHMLVIYKTGSLLITGSMLI